MREQRPNAIRLKDYRVPDYLIDRTELHFELEENQSVVRASLSVRRNPDAGGEKHPPLVLDGIDLELLEIRLDGEAVAEGQYAIADEQLTLRVEADAFTLLTRSRIHPETNSSLEGLYRSSSMFCTQCEAEGFRKITWYLDRPDVLSTFRTTIVADRSRYPVLLSNGNEVERGQHGEDRHWVTWENPFPMPCYLFALVAGDLQYIEDRFTTASGKEVVLRLFTEAENIHKCDFGMAALKRSMRWDEEVYSREYDLDIFMIVAVNDFNMGAMENKGLNIFNSSCVLAEPETATDAAFQRIEGIIAHEYFHNWSGNRVTCRDWFQLSLKEGFTVFRDQSFSADMGSATVKRIDDVALLRTSQFAEDGGPMAHPVRPDSYIEISNFYTVTIYEKGAEVIRMLHTLLGAKAFHKGTDLYFERHDGQAVTCDDFVQALEDANGLDLTRFQRWYTQAGTPRLYAHGEWDAARRIWTLHLKQELPDTPGQTDKQPQVIPVRMGLLDQAGQELPLNCAHLAAGTSDVVLLEEAEARIEFRDLPEAPVPSLLRGFSAPVRLEYDYANADLGMLMRHDSDGFNRWEASQRLGHAAIRKRMRILSEGRPPVRDRDLERALEGVFADVVDAAGQHDQAMLSRLLTLPGEAWLSEQEAPVDPGLIHQAREGLADEIARRYSGQLLVGLELWGSNMPYRFSPEECARRTLLNTCLGYLMRLDDRSVLNHCLRQFERADNMTEVSAALRALAHSSFEAEANDALARFYQKWQHDPLVVDQWLAIQAAVPRSGALQRVESLLSHPSFDYRNPNKLRSVIGVFCNQNLVNFHATDGSGYHFLAGHVLRLDQQNPQIAARMLSPLTRWRRYEPVRSEAMHAELERVLATGTLSKDVYEIASKALK